MIDLGFGHGFREYSQPTSQGSSARHLPLERLHQSTDVRLRLNLIHRQRLDIIRHITNRRQMIPFHVRSLVVGKRNEYRNQLVKTQCDFLSVVFESISNRKHRHAPNSRLKLLRVSSFQQSFKGKTVHQGFMSARLQNVEMPV